MRFVVAVMLVVGAASEGPADCSWHFADTGNTYNLAPIKKSAAPDYVKTIQVGPSIQFIYRMNVCANTLTTCQQEAAPATEALKIPAGETCRVLGRLDGMQVTELKNFPGSHVNNPLGQGVKIVYKGGDVCDPGTRSTRTVEINMVCNKNGDAAEGGEFLEVKKEATCNTVYTFSSIHACPGGAGGFGAKLIALIVIGTMVYCAVGAIVQRFVFKKEVGWDLVPNKDSWSTFGELVKEGVSFSVEKAKAMKNGEGGVSVPSTGGGAKGGAMWHNTKSAGYKGVSDGSG